MMRAHATFLACLIVVGCGSSDDGTSDVVARGEYLANHVAGCGNCHTPYAGDQPDTTRLFAGVPDRHNVAGIGTINSANLTPDETGLKTWTDDEIKRSIREGIRKDGSVMWPNMPYYELANLADEDLDAIVAYLRSVPPVQNALVRRPYTLRTEPFKPMTGDIIQHSTVAGTDTNYAMAQRGRYLASFCCVHCHTPNQTTGDYRRDPTKVFGGNYRFDPYLSYTPKLVYSRNLTPHENGIKDRSVAQVKEAIKNSGSALCKPMASLSKNYLSGMADDDATAIAIFLTTLPPIDTGVIPMCTP